MAAGEKFAADLVYAAETAIDEAAVSGEDTRLGRQVTGYVADFARTAVAAAIEEMAKALPGETCCPPGSAHTCPRCHAAAGESGNLRRLVRLVREVPAVEAV